VAAAPQERGEKQSLAATTVGLTVFLDGRKAGKSSRDGGHRLVEF
jgi:hypothetical protein